MIHILWLTPVFPNLCRYMYILTAQPPVALALPPCISVRYASRQHVLGRVNATGILTFTCDTERANKTRHLEHLSKLLLHQLPQEISHPLPTVALHTLKCVVDALPTVQRWTPKSSRVSRTNFGNKVSCSHLRNGTGRG